jgi:hypothetical protein
MELEKKGHSLDPVREALKEFEDAVSTREHRSFVESNVMKQQAVDRARERVFDEVMSLVRRTIAEREGGTEPK